MDEKNSWEGIFPPAHSWDWEEVPCKCGFTVESHPHEYEVYELQMTAPTSRIQLSPKEVPRCKTCKDISLIRRVEKK